MMLIAVALAGTAAPAPLLAANATTLACLTVDIDAAVPRRMAEEMLVAIEKGQDLPDTSPSIEAVAGQALTCKSRHDWSDAAFTAAITHAIALFTIPGAEKALARDGFDPAAVTGAFRSLSPEMRASFQADSIPEATIEAYFKAAEKAGITLKTEAEGGHIGMLAGLLSVAEGERAKFVSQ
jgi:hypothetical protein